MERAIRAFAAFPPEKTGFAPRWPGSGPFPFDAHPFTCRFARAAVSQGLRTLGIGPGDDVLMPSFHHGVEVETVRALGATVRFFPVGADLSCRPAEVAALIRPTTRVIYVVHYFGFPQPLADLRALCDARGLLLFEDCALSLLSAPFGVPLGSVGDAAAYCLYKTLPVPDGGLLVLRGAAHARPPRAALPELGRAIREAAQMVRARLRPSAPRPPPAVDTVLATLAGGDRARAGHPVFHPSQLSLPLSPVSRLLLASLDLAEIRRRRRRNFQFWAETVGRRLPSVTGALPPGACPLLFPILVDDKPGLCRALAADGIELHRWWAQRIGGAAEGEWPAADDLRRRLVGLPVHQGLAEPELERILAALRRHAGA